MSGRAHSLLAILVLCLALLAGCGGAKEETANPPSDLSFTGAKVDCSKRDGLLGGRYANFTLTAMVKNDTDVTLNKTNMPTIASTNGEESFDPKLFEENLGPGESCEISYEGEFDVKHNALPTLSFKCELTYSGLEEAEASLNAGLKDVLSEYEQRDAEADAKRAKAEEEKRAEEGKAAETEKALEDCKGKTADEALEVAKTSDYAIYFEDLRGVDVTHLVKNDSDSEAHGASVLDVKFKEGFITGKCVTFSIDFTDQQAVEEEAEKRQGGSTETERPIAQSDVAEKPTVEQPEQVQQTAPTDDSVITAENNEEFATLLSVAREDDPLIGEFANKYEGRLLEFDATVLVKWEIEPDNPNVFDILLGAGTDERAGLHGPNMKYQRTNTANLHITNGTPKDLVEGTKVHCIARVFRYNAKSQLLLLRPEQTTIL